MDGSVPLTKTRPCALLLATMTVVATVAWLFFLPNTGLAQSTDEPVAEAVDEARVGGVEEDVDAACDAEGARVSFEDGLRFAGERRLADARIAYALSLSRCPRVPTGYNLAVVLQQLGLEVDAKDMVERLRAEEFGPLDGEQGRIIGALLRQLRRATAVLRLRVSGAPSVVVTVNGVPRGRAQEDVATEIPVRRGVVTVSVTADDGRARVVRREVPGRSVALSIELPLDQARGRIVASSENPDSEIEIVGVAVARGRLVRHLSPDQYRVRIRDGSDERSVQVLRGQTHRIHLDGSTGLLESPWFWIGTLFALGVGVTSAVVLLQPEAEPIEDPVWGRVQLLP